MSRDDVEPRLRQLVECHDGCGRYGTANADGCVRGCPCPKARGRRNRRSGLSKQREARKALGVKPNKFGDSNEENWSDALFATEVKSGAQCRPVLTAWLKAEAQIIANQPDHGLQHKVSRVVWMPAGMSDGLVTVRLSDYKALIRPALEEFYGGGDAA